MLQLDMLIWSVILKWICMPCNPYFSLLKFVQKVANLTSLMTSSVHATYQLWCEKTFQINTTPYSVITNTLEATTVIQTVRIKDHEEVTFPKNTKMQTILTKIYWWTRKLATKSPFPPKSMLKWVLIVTIFNATSAMGYNTTL